MTAKLLTKTMFVATGLSLAVSPLALSAAAAQAPGGQQGYAPPPPGYQQAPSGYDQRSDDYDRSGFDQQGGYDQGGDDQGQGYDPRSAPPPPRGGYDQSPPPGYGAAPPQGYGAPPPGYDVAPPGYDGSRPPPPPPGYQPGPEAAQMAEQDRQYAIDAQRWAQAYCVKSHGDVGAGAVIGGLFGAIVGSGLSGRHDHGTGALAGAAVGAAGGAAIASSTGGNATSPGCPPGFVVRGGAPAFYGSYGPTYAYAAPGWYRPWVFYGGTWVYRPYPYHVWYYRHYGYRPYGYGYRRPYYRRHW